MKTKTTTDLKDSQTEIRIASEQAREHKKFQSNGWASLENNFNINKMKTSLKLLIVAMLVSVSQYAQTWNTVGNGLDSTVNFLFNDTVSNRLYAAGAFTGKVAYWNGSTWTVIPGFPGTAAAFSVIARGNNLYVGAERLYKYNGSTWATVENVYDWQSDPTVAQNVGFKYATLNTANNYVYFAGYITGGNPAVGNNTSTTVVLRIDENDNVSNLYSTSAGVNKLVFIGGIYALNSNGIWKITESSATAANNSGLGGGNTYNSACFHKGDMYVGGAISLNNGTKNFIKYPNANTSAAPVAAWTNTVAGTRPYYLISYSGKIYSNLGVFDGTSFTSINAPAGNVYETYNGELYVAGSFTTAPYSRIARYNANPVLTLTASVVSNVSCKNGSNGSATVALTGGLPPYTFRWNNAQTNDTATNLTAGTYTVTVKDSAGMTKTAVVTITQPSTSVTATLSTTQESASGQNDGTATVSATGGVAGYTYNWNNSQSTNVATGLTAGVYTATVTDANGCKTVKSGTVTAVPAPTFTLSVINNVTCNNLSDGSARVSNTANGKAPFVYIWSNGYTGGTATGLAAGVYTVTLTDAANQVSTKTVTVTQPNVLTATVTAGSTTATVVASGGTPAYTYNWSSNDITSSVSGLNPTTTYSVTVTDNKGCTVTETVTTTSVTPGGNGGTTGIEENSNGVSVNVYPNPSNGVFNISIEGEATVDIISINGQVLRTFNVNGFHTVNFTEAGMFYLRIVQGDRVIVKSIINL